MGFIRIETYSDDCANYYPNGRPQDEVDESEFGGKWWPLLVDDQHVADVMATYGSSGWEFHIRNAAESHGSIELDLSADPEHEEGCNCDECWGYEDED